MGLFTKTPSREDIIKTVREITLAELPTSDKQLSPTAKMLQDALFGDDPMNIWGNCFSVDANIFLANIFFAITEEDIVSSITPSFKRLLMIIPLTNTNSHDYEIGKPIIITNVKSRYCLKSTGKIGNHMNKSPRAYKVATKEEIDDFFANASKKVFKVLSDITKEMGK